MPELEASSYRLVLSRRHSPCFPGIEEVSNGLAITTLSTQATRLCLMEYAE